MAEAAGWRVAVQRFPAEACALVEPLVTYGSALPPALEACTAFLEERAVDCDALLARPIVGGELALPFHARAGAAGQIAPPLPSAAALTGQLRQLKSDYEECITRLAALDKRSAQLLQQYEQLHVEAYREQLLWVCAHSSPAAAARRDDGDGDGDAATAATAGGGGNGSHFEVEPLPTSFLQRLSSLSAVGEEIATLEKEQAELLKQIDGAVCDRLAAAVALVDRAAAAAAPKADRAPVEAEDMRDDDREEADDRAPQKAVERKAAENCEGTRSGPTGSAAGGGGEVKSNSSTADGGGKSCVKTADSLVWESEAERIAALASSSLQPHPALIVTTPLPEA